MYFQSLTRRRGIGANSYLLDLDAVRLVLDAGMDPKSEGLEAVPAFDQLEYDSIDGIVLSHCHLDHVGSLPLAMRRFPRAHAYMTEPCAELSSALLHNSVNVMTLKREEQGLTEYPLFTHREIDRIERHWECRPTHKRFFIHGAQGDAEVRFFDAGHIMGSTGALIRQGDTRIFYTGDVNFTDQTLTEAAAFPREPVDMLIMEGTRGAVERSPSYCRKKESRRLADVISQTIKREGSVLIPVFAMGKTQEMLMMLHLLHRENAIPPCPIFIGGLSTKMTVIYDRFSAKVPRKHARFEILREMDLTIASRRRRKEITYSPRCIYALSSGMMTENTISNKFAHSFLDNPRNTLVFVGYADPESPAGKIRQAKKGDLIQLDPNQPPIELHCDVEEFDFSGHADREDLRRFANELAPRKIVLVHGDEDALEWFQTTLSGDLPGTEVVSPGPGERVMLNR